MGDVFRIEPAMPPEAYRTFRITSPLKTHMRQATCEEIGCDQYRNGWRVHVEALTPDVVHAAKTAGRRYREEHLGEGQTWLVFEAGQPCFRARQHRAPLGRPPLYVVQDGDHRGNPRGTKARVHARPSDWVENFAEHQQALADEIKKG
ncbi:hypothetical protein [Streptomyces sp. NPDC005302]|uniref:hypothetical protein n=1 Tax=Streptomyces sp. NPDC005302 TaxID=3154675 RepID=UPI0033A532D3